MYCPKCGVTIGDFGNFCAKCGKEVDYLRNKDAAEALAVDKAATENSQVDGVDNSEKIVSAARQNVGAGVKQEKGLKTPGKKTSQFFCNYCGTMVYGDDNFCYSCSKVLQKKVLSAAKK